MRNCWPMLCPQVRIKAGGVVTGASADPGLVARGVAGGGSLAEFVIDEVTLLDLFGCLGVSFQL